MKTCNQKTGFIKNVFLVAAMLIVLGPVSVLAQSQGQERANSQSSSISKSAGNETSIYRVMVDAFLDNNFFSVEERRGINENIFGDQGTCVYVTKKGELLGEVSLGDGIDVWTGSGDNRKVRDQMATALGNRLPMFLALSEITQESFPAIARKNMNAVQAKKYLALQFEMKLRGRLLDVQSRVPKKFNVYFDADQSTPVGSNAHECNSRGSHSGVGSYFNVAYGALSKWRMVADNYTLAFDGYSFSISKNGHPYIADGVVMGSNLTVRESTSAERSSAISTKKNQVGN